MVRTASAGLWRLPLTRRGTCGSPTTTTARWWSTQRASFASGAQVPAVTISADASGALNSPLGLAFDRSGDLWVAANLSNKLLEYAKNELVNGPEVPAVTISADALGSLDSPSGLAFDPSGDLWVANYGDNSLAEFAPAQLALSGSLGNERCCRPQHRAVHTAVRGDRPRRKYADGVSGSDRPGLRGRSS